MPMVWYIPPLSPVVDVVARHRRRRRGHGQPVRRHRRAAHPGRVPGRAVHRRRRRAGGRRAAASWPRCAPTCATSTWAATRDESIPAAVGHDRAGRSTTCTGCWPSPSTTSATSSRPPTPSRRHSPRGARHRVLASDYDGGPGMGGSGPFGEGSGRADARSRWRTSTMLQDRQTADTLAGPATRAPGQPAELGRQGRTAGPVPARRADGRSDVEPADAPTAARLTRREQPLDRSAVAVGLAAARLPRRRTCSTGSPADPGARPQRCRRPSAARSSAVPRPPGGRRR